MNLKYRLLRVGSILAVASCLLFMSAPRTVGDLPLIRFKSNGYYYAAKLKGLPLEVEEATIERQCDNVFLEQAADTIKKYDAVLSLGCGAGVQALAERYTTKPVYAGLDTAFIGILEERGGWAEKCATCGACVLHQYGGICPITRCAKHMLNGPCSGSREDRCEVDPARTCAWQLIYQRLKEIGQLDQLKKAKPPKNWRPSLAGGCRTIIREDHRV